MPHLRAAVRGNAGKRRQKRVCAFAADIVKIRAFPDGVRRRYSRERRRDLRAASKRAARQSRELWRMPKQNPTDGTCFRIRQNRAYRFRGRAAPYLRGAEDYRRGTYPRRIRRSRCR